jgi:hypothetical protein
MMRDDPGRFRLPGFFRAGAPGAVRGERLWQPLSIRPAPMRYLMAFLLSLWLPALAATACPDYQRPGAERIARTGHDLWRPEVISLRAGGDRGLEACGFGVRGFVRRVPDLDLRLTAMERYGRLLIRVNSEGCDPVLLLRDPQGRWHFDDDSGTGRTASLSLPAPADGRYVVWAGTYRFHSRPCEARLTLESF